MRCLYADIWVGEMGWELFAWSGYLRKQSHKYDKCIVACKSGHEMLYEDFAAEIISCDIACKESDMWDCKGYKTPSFEERFNRRLSPGDKYHPSCQPVLRYDHTHKHDKEPLFARFKDQEFVKYGDKRAGGYDVVVHVRDKSNKVNAGRSSDYRNWDVKNWDLLAPKLEGLRVCCIGTPKSSLCPLGDDLRGANLKLASNVLASSEVLISASSGPVHLAALCGCPTITWWGDPYGPENEIRYRKDWNPLETPVTLKYVPDWQAPVDWVAESIEQYI